MAARLTSMRQPPGLSSVCRAIIENAPLTMRTGDVCRGMFMTPTRVQPSPSPVKTILGTLSRTETLLQALEWETLAA